MTRDDKGPLKNNIIINNNSSSSIVPGELVLILSIHIPLMCGGGC